MIRQLLIRYLQYRALRCQQRSFRLQERATRLFVRAEALQDASARHVR